MNKKQKMNKKEKMYLVTGGYNWADEIDFDGFSIITEKQLERYMKYCKEHEGEEFEFYCGSNQEVCGYCYGDVLYELETAYELTDKEYETITDLIGREAGDILLNNVVCNMESESEEENE